MSELKCTFYNKKEAESHDHDIEWPDIYFTPEYGYACEISDPGSTWEYCHVEIYNESKTEIVACLGLVYLKIPLDDKANNWRLLTPYGYSGGFWIGKNRADISYWWPHIRQVLVNNGCTGDIIIRQNPYIENRIDWSPLVGMSVTCKGMNSSVTVEIKKTNTLYMIDYDKPELDQNILNYNRRRDIKLAIKHNIKPICYINNINNCPSSLPRICLSNIRLFESEYNNHMEYLSANSYYKFDSKYYDVLFSKLASTSSVNHKIRLILMSDDLKLNKNNNAGYDDDDNNNNIIGGMIGLEYPNCRFVHYHLSFNNRQYTYLNTYILYSYWKLINEDEDNNNKINKIFILGCGVKEGDGLAKFKKAHSNRSVPYIIYSL